MSPCSSTSCVVVDAGARYGLHPTWQLAEHFARFDLYEPEPTEAARLARKYENSPNVSVRQLALGEQAGYLTFGIRRHKALSSKYGLSTEAIRENYKRDEFEEIEKITVPVNSLDQLYPSEEVHFLKLDVEGAELDVLHGAHDLLSRSIQGVRAEVCFSPVFSGAPVFGDIDALLRAYGLVLLNLDYDGRGVAKSPFTLGDKFGRLYSSDGVWVRPNEVLCKDPALETSEALLRQSLFLLLNNASDYAIDALRMWVSAGANIDLYREDALFRCVKLQVAILFKDLHYVPQVDKQNLQDTWMEIFREPFPELHTFWEYLDR